MQFQADIIGEAVQRPAVTETTGLGAALMAGLALGIYKDLPDTARGWHVADTLTPSMDRDERKELLKGWKKAVDTALFWAKED